MKTLLVLILSMVLSLAHAEYIDLEGGDVVRQALCSHKGKKLLCVAVKKDGKLYVVIYDEKGELSITWISPKGDIFLWGRNVI